MKKYEVRIFSVETKRGNNVMDTWNDSTSQETELVKACDTLEEAKAIYDTINTDCRSMGGYYLHTCKCIEVNEYDEDGEWVTGGDWECHDMPERKGGE